MAVFLDYKLTRNEGKGFLVCYRLIMAWEGEACVPPFLIQLYSSILTLQLDQFLGSRSPVYLIINLLTEYYLTAI
jgi:hypothetical protein